MVAKAYVAILIAFVIVLVSTTPFKGQPNNATILWIQQNSIEFWLAIVAVIILLGGFIVAFSSPCEGKEQ